MALSVGATGVDSLALPDSSEGARLEGSQGSQGSQIRDHSMGSSL